MYEKIIKMPEFYMILAGQIILKNTRIFMIFARNFYKIPELYMIFARKMPEFYIIMARKNFSDFFGGGGARAPRLLRLCIPCSLCRLNVFTYC